MRHKQNKKSLEGKETRFGTTARCSGPWPNAAASNGSVNGMHDSLNSCCGRHGRAVNMIIAGGIFGGVAGVGLNGMLLNADRCVPFASIDAHRLALGIPGKKLKRKRSGCWS